jgi:LacI family transcriptional regulator
MNLKEVSQVLGLSQTTVSRALNGYPEVNKSTRQRVEAAAVKYHYSPNTRAKGLATGRALTIGHVIAAKSKQEMVNPIFGDFIAGAGEIYGRNGYEMILSIVDSSTNEETVYRGLNSRRAVDGVVVQAPVMQDKRIDLLSQIGLPFVVHGRASGVSSAYSWLDVNNKRAFERATKFLLDLGHVRIALLNGLEDMDFAHRRRAGYVDALNAHTVSPDPALMFSDEMTENYGYDTVRILLDQPNSPTAILTASMISALGARRAIEERGLVMGRDVSVVTHDDMLSYLPNSGDIPMFTATRSSVRQAGGQVAQMLLAQINDPFAAPQHKMLEAELIIGRSTGPAPLA